jgi:hypothetical protein
MPLLTDYETNDPDPAAALNLTNLEVNSLRTLSTTLAARPQSNVLIPRPETGAYVVTPYISTGLGTLSTANVMFLVPVDIAVATAFNQIASRIEAVGTGAGQVLRLGYYSDDGTGARPLTLLLDAGTVTTLTGTGIKGISITQTLQPGRYWLALALQGTVTSGPNMVSTTCINQVGSADLSNNNQRQWVQAGVSAALPGTIGTLTRGASSPMIGLRVA